MDFLFSWNVSHIYCWNLPVVVVVVAALVVAVGGVAE